MKLIDANHIRAHLQLAEQALCEHRAEFSDSSNAQIEHSFEMLYGVLETVEPTRVTSHD